MALQLQSKLMIAEPGDMTPERLDQLAQDIGMLLAIIASAYFT